MDESRENRKIETKELVRQYLKRKYPDAQFSDIDLDFLVRYSVKKEPSANTILKSIGNDIQTEQAYYNAHPAVKAAKDDFQYIYGRFSQKQKDYKNACIYCIDVLLRYIKHIHNDLRRRAIVGSFHNDFT